MNLVSSQVSVKGDANLRVVGTAADPVILGRTNLTGGEFFLAGNRYEVDHGTIDFLNPGTHRAGAEHPGKNQDRRIQHHTGVEWAGGTPANNVYIRSGIAAGGHHQPDRHGKNRGVSGGKPEP